MWSPSNKFKEKKENVKPSSSLPVATSSKSVTTSALCKPIIPISVFDSLVNSGPVAPPSTQSTTESSPPTSPAPPPNSPAAFEGATLWQPPAVGELYLSKPPVNTPFNDHPELAPRPRLPLKKPYSACLNSDTMGTATERRFYEEHLTPKKDDDDEEIPELWEMGPNGRAVRVQNGYSSPGYFGEGPVGYPPVSDKTF
ncbi:uncharacterized protein RAG0_07395 [Rhynchosporium agropyri]|uniref:Uncharacterized protein n=1 Tax=Rhynchosporium agropyri TaxID=914238 RepID=A0A1E1KPL1_9HELO|nr:uncharacterized protein RAG0_07395 [Rhynchosporium agropyri]